MENKRVPEIRFAGFSGDWEQRRFKEFISKTGKKNTMGENYPAYSVSNKLGLVRQTEQFDGSRLDDLDKTSYKIVNPNEFAYNPARINVGSIAFNNLNKTVIVSSLYVVLKMSEELDNEFILQFIKSQFFIDEVRRNTEGSVREYLFFENFKNIKFPYTPNKEEQTKIGNFFKQLDDMIALQQRELDALKETKKAFLQKMFPKQGKSVPEVRFPGFTGNWEERKLGDHAEILTGGTPKTQVKEYWEPREIPWMSSGEVNKKRLSSTDNMISTLGFENSSARWVKENSILIALAGQGKTRGTVAINEIPLTTNQSIAAIVPKDELHYEFVFQNLEKRYEELRLISSGDGTRGGLNKQLVSDVEILSPSIKEQTKIGNFFKQLDDMIALQQRELDALKETKKAFLQKMFV